MSINVWLSFLAQLKALSICSVNKKLYKRSKEGGQGDREEEEKKEEEGERLRN